MAADKPVQHFHCFSKCIHLLTALLCSLAFIMAWKALATPSLDVSLLETHYAIGLLVLLLSILRLVTLHLVGKPKALGSPLARVMACMGHYALYLVIFMIPLSGMLLIAAKAKPLLFFGITLWSGFPERTGWLIRFASELHQSLVWGSTALLLVHVAASLYHHFILKDITLVRMLGSNK
ncbi:cytochrome b [Shewanella cyperi]|uniref:cytochrome b n=1 Tax=Shewanella cyperi TaxID=2814292 RepID=UPI001A94717D|nr:cytochrome b/b6 domain-containing protein [Shewanella cyperi]QSX41278.1 cytochrome b [Shewanella cyperi]